MTEGDHFSYRDHNFWTEIRSCGNRFPTTMDFRVFTGFIRNSFTGPYRALCEGHFHPNRSIFFRISIFFGQMGWGFEPTLQTGQVGPKRHPKSLVCASERYNRKYRDDPKYPGYGLHLLEWNEIFEPRENPRTPYPHLDTEMAIFPFWSSKHPKP